MKTKTLLSTALLLGILSGILSGCGGGSETKKANEGSQTPGAPTKGTFVLTPSLKKSILSLSGTPRNECILKLTDLLADGFQVTDSAHVAQVLDSEISFFVGTTCTIQPLHSEDL